MPDFAAYQGMSYEQASREGARLVAQANFTGNWHSIVDKLTHLRALMRQLRGAGLDGPKPRAGIEN